MPEAEARRKRPIWDCEFPRRFNESGPQPGASTDLAGILVSIQAPKLKSGSLLRVPCRAAARLEIRARGTAVPATS